MCTGCAKCTFRVELHQAQYWYAWELLHALPCVRTWQRCGRDVAEMWVCEPETTPTEEKIRPQKTSENIASEGNDRRRQYMHWVGAWLCGATATGRDTS